MPKLNIIPQRDWVLVDPVDVEVTTPGGVLLPAAPKEPALQAGVIVARDESDAGRFVCLDTIPVERQDKVGTVVLYDPRIAVPTMLLGEPLHFVRASLVVAFLEGAAPSTSSLIVPG